MVCKQGSSLADYASHETDTLVLRMPPESSDAGFAMTSSVSCMALGTYCVFNWRHRDAFLEQMEKLADCADAEMPAMDQLAREVAQFGYKRLICLGGV